MFGRPVQNVYLGGGQCLSQSQSHSSQYHNHQPLQRQKISSKEVSFISSNQSKTTVMKRSKIPVFSNNGNGPQQSGSDGRNRSNHEGKDHCQDQMELEQPQDQYFQQLKGSSTNLFQLQSDQGKRENMNRDVRIKGHHAFQGQENKNAQNYFIQEIAKKPQQSCHTKTTGISNPNAFSGIEQIKPHSEISQEEPRESPESIALTKCFEFFLDTFPSDSKKNEAQLMQLNAMIERSNTESLEAHPKTYKALSKGTVDSLSLFCRDLGVNNATMFRAYEIYDRFMIRLNDNINGTTKCMNTSEKDSVRSRIVSQGPLRMCTCILLASKLHSDNRSPSLTTVKIRNLLRHEGYCYKLEAIEKSEIRVIGVLNYRLQWVTPFELVEQIIVLLDLPEKLLPEVYKNGMLLLELCYQLHHDLYTKLWSTKCPQNSSKPSEDERLKGEFEANFERNIPLRSASIVSCSLCIASPDKITTFCKEVGAVTSLNVSEINELACHILYFATLPSTSGPITRSLIPVNVYSKSEES